MSTDTIFGFPVQVCDTLPYDNIRLVSDGKVLRLINVQDPHFKQEGVMNKEETAERKETVAESFHISDEREFVERLAGLDTSDGFASEQIRNIRSIAQDLLKNRAASTPETTSQPIDEKEALLALLRERPMKATEILRRMFGPYSEAKLKRHTAEMIYSGELLMSADRYLSIAPAPPLASVQNRAS